MIEAQDARMVRRQPFVEVTHPVVLDANLFRRQARARLRPLGRSSLACGPIAIAVSCRLNESPLS
jgi:predicted kinase